MAQYNADIRVGITGKTQLNALEKQLGRINKDLNQINKNLKAQTLTINTKGANRALDQLDRKINKLNRTIKVTANINERRRRSEGGGTTVISGGGGTTPVAQAAVGVALNEQLKVTKKLNKAELNRVETNQKLNDQFNKINAKRAEEAKLLEKIDRVRKGARVNKKGEDFNRVAGGLGLGNKTEPALKDLNKQLRGTRLGLSNLEGRVPKLSQEFAQASKNVDRASTALDTNNKKLKENAKVAAATAKSRKQIGKFAQGAFAGGGVAAASALGQVPVLGGAATGGLVGGLTAGPAGAFGGAVAGGIADATTQLAAFSTQATKTATDIARLNKSLELAAGADYAQSLLVIRRVVEDFNTPLTDATEQFTKLFASAQGSGLALGELEDLYVGLAAGNKAFAGSTEDLNGILRAFTQIISKGTVQSEELKGQVGERLPGAFALAAESLGMTTAELQKALENGEVNSAEFVRKFGRYMLQFEDKAKTIADSPVEAGARLQKAITDLENEVGGDLASLGADFQDLATIIVTELIPVAKDLIQFAKELKAVLSPLKDIAVDLGEAMSGAGLGLGDFLRQVILSIPLVRELFLGMKGLVELGKAIGIGNADEGVYGGLPADYKQTELAMIARAERFRNGNKNTKEGAVDLLDPSGSGSGSGSGPRSTLADTQLDIQLQRELLAIEKERTALIGKNDEMAEFALQQRELEKTLIRDLAAVDLDNLDAASKEAEKTLLQVKYQTDLVRLTNEQKQAKFELQEAFDEQVRDLELQVALEEAVTEEKRNQLQLEARLAEIDDGPGSKEQKAQLKALENRLKEARDGNQGVSGYMKQLQKELGDTQAMIISLAQTVESELATAMSSAITGLIDGTKTAEEAFADMFRNIGKAFIDMATQMIAKALVMKALGILTGSTGGGSGTGWAGASQLSSIPRIGYAEGGYVTSPTQAMIGEAGEPEYAIPSSKMSSALSRYSQGMRGEAVTAGASEYGDGSGGGTGEGNGAVPASHFTLDTVVINSVEYATVEQVRQMGATATANGARAGEARALGRLRTSVGARRKLGMS